MRALTILLLVVAASLAVVVSGDEEKHREKRLFGGFMNLVNTFKDRISGVAKDVGKAAKSATRYGFKWTSDFSRNQFIDARKSFRKIAPKVDFRKAVSALSTVLDSGFVNSLCRFSCVSAANTVFQSSSQTAQTQAGNTAKIGCGPVCNGLTGAQALDYDEVKKALTKKYDLTKDGYRRIFRICKAEEGESAEMFRVRIKIYLSRWVELLDTKQTYEDVRDLFVRKQLMDACPEDLVCKNGRECFGPRERRNGGDLYLLARK
ncbi:reverse transcriptase [Plakobranchus ocellatus]|uniref:Reverse transcriptase n=1 Tax=Plakobranchus ocellatus TaxID=259542 RepID=A0AAV3ZLY9_9GAST|nr:reverse transcriptase [Plakobranchus ocellatus]